VAQGLLVLPEEAAMALTPGADTPTTKATSGDAAANATT